MSYSFTEKKRRPKRFGKRASVPGVPALLATQIESHKALKLRSVRFFRF